MITPEWIGIAIAYFGLVVAFYQLRDLRKTPKRTESPFFEFSHHSTMVTTDNKPVGVVLMARNKGGVSRLTRVSALSDCQVKMGEKTLIEPNDWLEIRYDIDKKRLGKTEKIKISYETVSGERGEQVFSFPHYQSDYRQDFKRLKIR